MKPRPSVLSAAAPILRRLPPWWAVRLYARLGDQYHQGGFGGRVVRRPLQPHGLQLDLELDDWSERLAYVCGCYYDVAGTAVVQDLVQQGDLFLDVGANVGFMSLLAARQVGHQGRVVCFEPNPRLVSRLQHCASLNGLQQVRIEALALSDANGEAKLDLTNHSGTASLRHQNDAGVLVRLQRGDDVLSPHLATLPNAPVFVKIDVEGFEHRVLKGVPELLRSRDVALLVEVTDRWLREAGSSAQALIDDLVATGHEALVPHTGPSSKLRLAPLADPARRPFQFDVLFLPRHGAWRERAVRAGLFAS